MIRLAGSTSAVVATILLLAAPAVTAKTSSTEPDALPTAAEETDAVADATVADATEDAGQAGSEADPSSQTQEEPQEPPPAAATSRPLAGALSKLQIHGFLTQAYADASFVSNRIPLPDGSSRGPTFDELALGIPEDGTSSYRNLALQFRYEISPRDIMVIQLSNRAIGDSPIGEAEDEIELDWAFYERRLNDKTSIRVGRVQIPIGIFNEIRDVGTILPFYRPSFSFYREGSFTTETVDGIDISRSFFTTSDWTLDLDVYAGNWESFELSIFGEEQATVADNEGYGFQLWLNAPSIFRLGLGGHHRDVSGGAEGILREIGDTSKFDDWYVSAEAVTSRFVFRAEYREYDNDPEPAPAFFATDLRSLIILYYFQLGYHVNEKIRFYGQMEQSESEVEASIFTQPLDLTVREDVGFAFNYLFRPNLVLKAEYHQVDGEEFTFIPIFTPGGLRLQPFVQGFDSGNYSIVSLSVSF